MAEVLEPVPAASAPREPVKPPYELEKIFMGAVIAALAVMALYFGQPVLVPIALAILLSLALGPLVAFLQRLYLGRVLSVVLGIVFALAVIAALGTFIGSQFAGLVSDLPLYQHNLSTKIESIRGSAAKSAVVQQASSAVQSITNQILNTAQSVANNKPPAVVRNTSPEEKPIPVVIRQPDPAPIAIMETIAGPLLQPLATLAIVIVFAGFILLQKDDLRDRFIRLAGSRDLQRATHLVDEGAQRLSRYLMLQTAVNTTLGIIIGLGLWAIGVPLPGLWGLLAAILRFVPYVGVPIAAVLPLTLGLAVDPGWSMVIWTLILYGTVEPITGQVIEPLLYGKHMGMSAVAVVIAATFWTWIWGPVGLLLSTPLTMCLVVLGRHTPQLQFLDIMLGDTPALSPDESFYLRMLDGDPDEAALRAEAFLKENSVAAYYDLVVMKALTLAQQDLNRGTLDEKARERIKNTVHGLIVNLADREDGVPLDEEEKTKFVALKPEDLAPSWRDHPVLCVAGRSVLDEAAANILTHLLERAGIGARAISADDASPSRINQLDVEGAQAICVSYLEPGNFQSARYLVRRMRKRIPHAVPIAGYWCLPGDATKYLDSIEVTECEFVVTSLSEAVISIITLAKRAAQNPNAARKAVHHSLKDSAAAV